MRVRVRVGVRVGVGVRVRVRVRVGVRVRVRVRVHLRGERGHVDAREEQLLGREAPQHHDHHREGGLAQRPQLLERLDRPVLSVARRAQVEPG